MITESEVIEIYCLADEFCQLFNNDKEIFCQSVQVNRKYNHEVGMKAAEIIVIMIMFHSSNNRTLKHF